MLIEEVVNQFRPAFEADGGELELVSVTDQTVKVKIIIYPGGCSGCIMPPPVVKEILENSIGQLTGKKYSVEVEMEDRSAEEL